MVGVQLRPVQVNIGIIVSAASLFGFTNTPGRLADRSALVSVDTIRDLAAQPGTLFNRLLTDDSGNLLGVTELGRFPSRKLGLAIGYRVVSARVSETLFMETSFFLLPLLTEHHHQIDRLQWVPTGGS